RRSATRRSIIDTLAVKRMGRGVPELGLEVWRSIHFLVICSDPDYRDESEEEICDIPSQGGRQSSQPQRGREDPPARLRNLSCTGERPGSPSAGSWFKKVRVGRPGRDREDQSPGAGE